MQRKPLFLAAAVAETLRFLGFVFLAFDLGALLKPSVSSLVRYGAAPQLLFAAGFFFLWLDPLRYAPYRPLLLVGKAANLLCLLPLAATLLGDPGPASLGLPFLGRAMGLLIALVDAGSLLVLILVRAVPPSVGSPLQGPSGSSSPGQGPEDIERVENL
jgi:hypothetical protein